MDAAAAVTVFIIPTFCPNCVLLNPLRCSSYKALICSGTCCVLGWSGSHLLGRAELCLGCPSMWWEPRTGPREGTAGHSPLPNAPLFPCPLPQALSIRLTPSTHSQSRTPTRRKSRKRRKRGQGQRRILKNNGERCTKSGKNKRAKDPTRRFTEQREAP